MRLDAARLFAWFWTHPEHDETHFSNGYFATRDENHGFTVWNAPNSVEGSYVLNGNVLEEVCYGVERVVVVLNNSKLIPLRPGPIWS